jgi:hypothetical protein
MGAVPFCEGSPTCGSSHHVVHLRWYELGWLRCLCIVLVAASAMDPARLKQHMLRVEAVVVVLVVGRVLLLTWHANGRQVSWCLMLAIGFESVEGCGRAIQCCVG